MMMNFFLSKLKNKFFQIGKIPNKSLQLTAKTAVDSVEFAV